MSIGKLTEIMTKPFISSDGDDFLLSIINEINQFALDNEYNIQPLPSVKFINDDENNADDFFGKTGYYIPSSKQIVLYTLNRHPKDIIRSYTHELIHHIQNINGTLNDIQTTNTNNNTQLDKIEREAYESGNILFRNWTDTITHQ